MPDNPLARAFGGDPAPFQELLDALESAGGDAAILPDPDARELAAVAAKLRAQAGWLTAAAADRELREAAINNNLRALGGNLLAVGFGPADWALRPLLEAAVAAYAEAELVLEVVDYEQTAAAAWVGAWEETMNGPADWLEAGEIRAPFAPLAMEILTPVRTRAVPQKFSTAGDDAPVMWLADNLQAEADLAVAQALAFLSAPGDAPTRVGIVVGSVNSPLAREVAARLAALGLPHHDAPGYLPGRTGAQRAFEAWLDWQEDGRLAGLVNWIRAAGREGMEDNSREVEEFLKRAAREALTDDPEVIRAGVAAEWRKVSDGRRCAQGWAFDFLEKWPLLPESAAGEVFLKTILAAARVLRWPEEPEALVERAAFLSGARLASVPRAAVLRWVRAVTRVPGRTRDALGREPWARLQMVDGRRGRRAGVDAFGPGRIAAWRMAG